MAVIRLCLDTSAYSRLMRGQPKLQQRLEAADQILLPVTVLGEVYTGFQGGNRLEENLSLLAAFRSQPGVVIVDTTDNVAQRYAAIVTMLKQQGTPIPTNDIWIAATALENGGRLVAYDSHFAAVPGLLVEAP
ncbi:MAG: type II toxin-antitoxin system VapC family toxin [Planctomycetia bacterium]|nr:type II toxin-antitoxin system VapC family toxin [Planctomycetia bacterium]